MSQEICENALKLKQIIMEEGLYEEGMSLNDMEQIYKTLSRSKRSANDDNEYRELMSQTDLNCTNVELLKTDKDVNDVEKGNQTSETVIDMSINEQSLKNNVISKTETFKDVTFNFNASSKYKSVIPLRRNKNIIPILYYHPKFKTLSTKKKTEVIKLYLVYQQKRIIGRKINPVDQWDKPIVVKPRVEINEDLHKNKELETVESADHTAIDKQQNNTENFCITRSKRQVKRKNYEEVDSDDDFNTSSSKKTKSIINSHLENKNLELKNETQSTIEKIHSQKPDSDDDFGSPVVTKKSKLNDNLSNVIVNQSTPLLNPDDTTPKPKRWLSKINIQPYIKALSMPDVSNRTNKLFDKLKEEESNKPKPKEFSVKLDDMADLSDSSEDIFPTTQTVANIHTEITPKLKKGKGASKKKTQAKTRKKLNLKSSNEEKFENSITKMSATNFYGKNKENELDASNNNKSSASKMTQCPICSQSFPDSDIEAHASRCEQYEDSEVCVICNKNFLNFEMNAHKIKCLENITECSIEKSCENNTNKSKGFLCSVCDKYVVDTNQFEHASNCIAKLNDS